MDILICGTSAAEAWPALFCTCAACALARRLGGKNVRSRAAYMLDDRVRIDFGPDSLYHQHKYGLAYEKLQHLIFTHSHDDHLFPTDLSYRQAGFSIVGPETLQLWGNAKVKARIVKELGMDLDKYRLKFNQISAWQPVDLGAGLQATPILAAHDRSEDCVNYILETGAKRALIAHDTGWYDQETWDFLKGKPIDLLILDCTYGAEDNQSGHLGGAALVRFRDRLEQTSSLTPEATVVATHFSHNGAVSHDDLVTFFSPYGIQVAYDGLKLSM